MPTYAYACTQCAHAFDIVQSFSDASLTQCPECRGVLRKQYGAVGVTFKGGGFYRTDSRAPASTGAKSSSASPSVSTPPASSSSSGGSSASAATT